MSVKVAKCSSGRLAFKYRGVLFTRRLALRIYPRVFLESSETTSILASMMRVFVIQRRVRGHGYDWLLPERLLEVVDADSGFHPKLGN